MQSTQLVKPRVLCFIWHISNDLGLCFQKIMPIRIFSQLMEVFFSIAVFLLYTLQSNIQKSQVNKKIK